MTGFNSQRCASAVGAKPEFLNGVKNGQITTFRSASSAEPLF
jgi:hypothetical protein